VAFGLGPFSLALPLGHSWTRLPHGLRKITASSPNLTPAITASDARLLSLIPSLGDFWHSLLALFFDPRFWLCTTAALKIPAGQCILEFNKQRSEYEMQPHHRSALTNNGCNFMLGYLLVANSQTLGTYNSIRLLPVPSTNPACISQYGRLEHPRPCRYENVPTASIREYFVGFSDRLDSLILLGVVCRKPCKLQPFPIDDLSDSASSPLPQLPDKYSISSVIAAPECAHKSCGDLVKPRKWPFTCKHKIPHLHL
jgi:hypothetical protein